MDSLRDTVWAGYERVNREWYAQLGGGGTEIPDGDVSDDWEFDPPPDLPGSATYRGTEGARRFLSELDDVFSSFRAEPQELVAEGGGEVVVRTRVLGTGRHSGVDIDRNQFHILTLGERGTRRIRCFGTRAEAMRAARLED